MTRFHRSIRAWSPERKTSGTARSLNRQAKRAFAQKQYEKAASLYERGLEILSARR